LDEQKLLYVICQTYTKDGLKTLVIRSPMQVTNNLQIPIEVSLLKPQVNYGEKDPQNLNTLSLDSKGRTTHPTHSQGLERHDMVVQAESSSIIPLRACNFDKVRIKPKH